MSGLTPGQARRNSFTVNWPGSRSIAWRSRKSRSNNFIGRFPSSDKADRDRLNWTKKPYSINERLSMSFANLKREIVMDHCERSEVIWHCCIEIAAHPLGTRNDRQMKGLRCQSLLLGQVFP
jgi:hypothetical protein